MLEILIVVLIKSFIAISKANQCEQLSNFISSFENCEVTSPESKEKALVVVMENADEKSERALLESLHMSESLEHLVLVSSLKDEEQDEK